MSKVKRSLLLKDFYRSYAIRTREKGIKPKSRHEHRAILRAMGDVMSEMLLEHGIIAMPWKIGDVFFKETDIDVPSIDYKASKEVGKKVYHVNGHNDQIIYSAFWLSPERQHKKKKMWCFSLYRGTKRKMAQLTKSGKKYPNFKLLNKRATK